MDDLNADYPTRDKWVFRCRLRALSLSPSDRSSMQLVLTGGALYLARSIEWVG